MKKSKIISELEKIQEQLNLIYDKSHRLNDLESKPKEFSDFELLKSIQFDAFHKWLGDSKIEEKLNKEFAKFGIIGDGSSIAVWLNEDTDLLTLPIVLISSSGDLRIIAPNYLMFILLSSLGYDVFQLLKFEKDGAKPWAEPNQLVLNWLKENFELIAPKNIKNLIARTRKNNTNIEEYVFSISQ